MPTTPPLGRRYAVAGRQLLLHCTGSGGPSLVLLPGAGLVGFDFLNIQERAAEFTTSVLYDRAGTGWSEAADLPRSAADVAVELHELLQTTEIPGPYLLAGHSLGGLVLDRDLNAARNLAGLVSSHSWWATENEPDGNPRKTRTTRAAGTATGRPAPPSGAGQRRSGNAPAQDTLLHVS